MCPLSWLNGVVNFSIKFKAKVKRQKEVIVSLINRTDASGVDLYMAEAEKLNELLSQEEAYWKQRAKIFGWRKVMLILDFFHAFATSRKKVNSIAYLEKGSGVKVNDHEGMCRVVKQYYDQIFKASGQTSIEETEPSILVSESQNRNLIREVTFEKFSLADKQMHLDKASGLDGLIPAFF